MSARRRDFEIRLFFTGRVGKRASERERETRGETAGNALAPGRAVSRPPRAPSARRSPADADTPPDDCAAARAAWTMRQTRRGGARADERPPPPDPPRRNNKMQKGVRARQAFAIRAPRPAPPMARHACARPRLAIRRARGDRSIRRRHCRGRREDSSRDREPFGESSRFFFFFWLTRPPRPPPPPSHPPLPLAQSNQSGRQEGCRQEARRQEGGEEGERTLAGRMRVRVLPVAAAAPARPAAVNNGASAPFPIRPTDPRRPCPPPSPATARCASAALRGRGRAEHPGALGPRRGAAALLCLFLSSAPPPPKFQTNFFRRAQLPPPRPPHTHTKPRRPRPRRSPPPRSRPRPSPRSPRRCVAVVALALGQPLFLCVFFLARRDEAPPPPSPRSSVSSRAHPLSPFPPSSLHTYTHSPPPRSRSRRRPPRSASPRRSPRSKWPLPAVCSLLSLPDLLTMT
jgi:hypothetical protein